MPQRERIIFLVRLGERFFRVAGVLTAFTSVGGYPVLNVIPYKIPGRAATVGCRYRDGRWWFYDVRSGALIRPASELDAAASDIRVTMSKVRGE